MPLETSEDPSSLDRLYRLLRSGHRLTKAEVAERLSVSMRQVQRLVHQLEEHGIPVQEGRRGRKKEYFLPEGELQGARVELDLSEDEALALALAATVIRSGEGPIPLEADLEQAFQHILAGIDGQALTFESTSLEQCIHVRRTSTSEVRGALFLELLRAIMNRRRLQMDYHTASTGAHASGRRFEPYGLAQRGDTWLCVAHDPGKMAMRDFSLARMQRVQPADPRSPGGDYQIPEDFDLEVYFSGRYAAVSGDEAYAVRLRVSPEAAQYFRSKVYQETQLIEREEEDGHLIVSYDVLGLEEITTMVQGWGTKVEVLAPEKLRAQVAAEARAVADLYASA